MSLNLNTSGVDLNDASFTPMLKGLQANILKFHGRNFAYHLFFKFKDGKIAEAKNWLRHIAGAHDSSHLTSAKKQLEDAKAFKAGKIADGGPLYTLSLSYTGYQFLQIADEFTPDSPQFRAGLRGSASLLKDEPGTWIGGFEDALDMLFIVAEDDPKKLENIVSGIVHDTQEFADLIVRQRGNVLKTVIGIGIEHFGYADGVSQPMYLADEINAQSHPRIWDDETPLDRLLVAEKTPSNILDAFGSYLVFRKLEQNVVGFKDASGDNIGVEGSEEPILFPVAEPDGLVNNDLSGAMIVGRFENGTPATMLSHAFQPDPHTLTNDFDYSDDLLAKKCPYFAHIRLVNPRNGDPKANAAEVRTHRITRRGIPFDDHDEQHKRIPDEKITAITDEMLVRSNQPAGDVGLLFMCYQSDINAAFEELQGQWANTGVIDPNFISKGQDLLIGQDTPKQLSLPVQWGDTDALPQQGRPFEFGQFVTMQGGEYFFTPSLYFLKEL